MSISVNGVTRTSPIANSGTGAAADPAVPAKAVSRVESTDAKPTPQAAPLRFPWLSRLTAELEPVAKQKPAFASTPSLGENLDQAV